MTSAPSPEGSEEKGAMGRGCGQSGRAGVAELRSGWWKPLAGCGPREASWTGGGDCSDVGSKLSRPFFSPLRVFNYLNHRLDTTPTLMYF